MSENTPIHEEEGVELIETGMSIGIEYADVIEIISVSNRDYHERTFFIDYIDDTKIKLLDTQTLKEYTLTLDENTNITDESITEIRLISRSDTKGYAINNGLDKLVWVNIHFSGDFPTIITGQITNIEYDRIEITVYPSLEMIYIDFEYKGLPQTIPIEKIIIREKPGAVNTRSIASLSVSSEEPHESEEMATVEYTDANEMIVSIPENYEADIDVRDSLQSIYMNADNIIFGEDEETISQIVELSEMERTYTIDAQVNSFLDELLSTVPDNQRTRSVMSTIHTLIERFRELREEYSRFDDMGNVLGFMRIREMDKPLVKRLIAMNTELRWIMPVISGRRKIHDANLLESGITDVVDMTSDVEILRLQEMQDNYNKSGSLGTVSKYKQLIRLSSDIMTPIIPPLFTENSINYANTTVLCNIDAVIGSLDNFYSTVVENSKISRQRFVIQRYNLGDTTMDKVTAPSGKKVFVRTNVTDNESMSIKSLLVFPEPVMRFSRISLPTTSIMERAILGNSFILIYRILHKKINIDQEIIDNLDKEIDYETDQSSKFMGKCVKEYVLDQELIDTMDQDTYKKFLEVLIPNTQNLIKLIQTFSPNSYSMLEVIRILEPFMIYSKDITQEQYIELKLFVKESIKIYKTTIRERGDAFNLYRNTNFNVSIVNNVIQTILKERKNIMDVFIQEYITTQPSGGSGDTNRKEYVTSSESLSIIARRDNGRLFSTLMQFMMSSLRLPTGFIKSHFDSDESSDMGRLESIKPTDCARKFITKKYTTLAELQRDNNAVIFYDKDYDDTPYEILNNYKKIRPKYSEPEFIEFLTTTLVLSHQCPSQIANETAMTLISGHKLVRDGEYAIFEMRPNIIPSVNTKGDLKKYKTEIEIEEKVKTVIHYYLRKKNHWIKDNSVSETSFMNNNMLFCNINASCVKNSKTSTCDTLGDSMTRMRSHLSMEADERIAKTGEEMERELEEQVNHAITSMNSISRLRYVQTCRANNLAFEIGKMHVSEELIKSPNAVLRDFILSQDDFSKKQHDIVRFVDNGSFCRQPMLSVHELNESPFWIYCMATNRQLIPMFMYSLAKTYITGANFQQCLDKICRIQGVISDDNDAIVDKHSGYVIRKIELSSDEGFDEFGYKITTNEIMERDASIVISDALRKKDEVFDTEQSQLIYNIFISLCDTMGIHPNAIQDFVLVTSNNCIMNTVMSESAYEKTVATRLKKDPNKKPISYILYKNQTIIISVAAVILIGIQTAVPSYKPKITAPGCIMSFGGYPLEGGDSDLRGIKYIACSLDRSKSSLIPWNSVKNMPTAVIESSIKRILMEYLMKTADVTGITALYIKKAEYGITDMDDYIPSELDMKKWVHFVPPMRRFTVVKSLHAPTSEFKSNFMSVVKTGDRKQRDMINALKSSVIMHGYAVIELINTIVSKKELIFKTTSNVPFMQNACCNNLVESINALEYFILEEPNIRKHLDIIQKASEIIFNTHMHAVAPILFHNINTSISRPPVQVSNFDDNIYSAFIYYCKFNSNIPIPMILRSICPEKPVGYNPTWSLMEKISFFRRSGRIYGEADLERIMTVINRRNTVNIIDTPKYNSEKVIIDLMTMFDKKESIIIEAPLRNHIMEVFSNYSPTKMTIESGESVNALKNYLILSNNRMTIDITRFLSKYGNMTSSELKRTVRTIETMSTWNIDTDLPGTSTQSHPGLYTAVQFIKNSIFNMSKVFPHIIMNVVKMATVPKHWNLSAIHERDIYIFMNKYYTKFSQYKHDEVLSRMLASVDENVRDIVIFLEHLPISTPITKDGNTFYRLLDKEVIHLLLNYFWISVLYEYVQMSDDPEFLIHNARIVNNDAESNRAKRFDIAGSIGATYRTLNDDEVELMSDINEVQISVGRADELKARVASLITTYVNIDREIKKHTDLTYDAFMEKTSRSKMAEKHTITDFFKNMDTEERRAENLMKQMKMGRWNVGLQKGIVDYDKAMYDKERSDMNELFIEEGVVSDTVGDMDENYFAEAGVGMQDVGDIDDFENAIADEDADDEAFNISNLNNDYMDDYYGDEGGGEDDGFGYQD